MFEDKIEKNHDRSQPANRLNSNTVDTNLLELEKQQIIMTPFDQSIEQHKKLEMISVDTNVINNINDKIIVQ